MKATKLCSISPRVCISLQVKPEYAIELDEIARRHGTTRHRFLLQLIEQGLSRLPASDATSRQS